MNQEPEFKTARKPVPSNWRLFHHSLKIAADILEETDFEPSIKQQETILRLLSSQVSNTYARDLR